MVMRNIYWHWRERRRRRRGQYRMVRKEEARRRRRRRRWWWFYQVSKDAKGPCHDATADVAVAVVAGVRSYWMRRRRKDQKRRLRRGGRVQNSGSGPKESASDSGRRLTSDVRDAGDGRWVTAANDTISRLLRRADRAPWRQHSEADGWVIDSLTDPGSIPLVFRADYRSSMQKHMFYYVYLKYY